MMLYVNFYNFDSLGHAFLLESISRSPPIHHLCWSEWNEKFHESPPDISLIYASDVPWREAVRISNLATGKCVILVGDRSPQIGLPIVRSAFKWADLPQFAGIEELGDDAVQPRPYPVQFAPTIPGSVMPLGNFNSGLR